jgi:hypothetical protein
VLLVIMKHMGKQARLLCNQLRSLYGSPGATLSPPETVLSHRSSAATLSAILSTITSWRYPADVQKLLVPCVSGVKPSEATNPVLDAASCSTLAAALPNLVELKCHSVFHASTTAPRSSDAITPLAALTSLDIQQLPQTLAPIASFAPNLRVLALEYSTYNSEFPRHPYNVTPPDRDSMWGTLLTLRSLQHLDLQVDATHLSSPAFPSTLRSLTGLTHLGLYVRGALAVGASVPERDVQALTRALPALPHLASVRLHNIRAFGGSLGSGLEALQGLRCLDIGEHNFEYESEDDEPGLDVAAGCLPCVSALPYLESLKLCGHLLARHPSAHELMQAMCGWGSTSLTALELVGMCAGRSTAGACHVLRRLPALRSLRMELLSHEVLNDSDSEHNDTRCFQYALAPHTQLQHVALLAKLPCFMPWLATLPGRSNALTELEVACSRAHELEHNLEVVARLSSLKKLVFGSDLQAKGACRLCMEAVKKLPLLEDVALWSGEWSKEDVLMLLPPPERLRSVVLGNSKPGAHEEWLCWGHDAIEQFNRSGVDVAVKPFCTWRVAEYC